MPRALAILVCLLPLAGCSSSQPATNLAPKSLTPPGLHNVFRVTDGVYSGSSPDGEAGFLSLKDHGIRTIISVDGAAPDVALAKQHGMRYVHLPIGYDGMTDARVIELAKAIRDLPGPVYVHCHHGKHRGPAAAAAAIRCLKPDCTAASVVQFLADAGTDRKYAGLYDLAERPPPKLDDAKIEFREVADVPDLTKRMVELDESFDRLKQSLEAKEATLLVEHYRELDRATQQQNEEFRKLLRDGVTAAEKVEAAIHEKRDAKELLNLSAGVCARCHAKFRDNRISSTP